jgi:hypothetical protein
MNNRRWLRQIREKRKMNGRVGGKEKEDEYRGEEWKRRRKIKGKNKCRGANVMAKLEDN